MVIPLGFHRDRWENCLQGWQAQSIADSQYELLLIAPPDFPGRDRLESVLAQSGGISRVVESDLRHDIGLCAVGAEHARGQFLFFTESHCWPEPDVLALCLQAFDEHSDWAGISCRSLRVASNRLAEAEAEMYDADITYGMTRHPWRKILDQCFVSRREAYMQCGGFKPQFGHFAEWALAANYHALGLFIGYLPEAYFHHRYTGELSELRPFTLDFVRGEIRYLTEGAGEPGYRLIDLPNEWMTQGNLERPLAQPLLKQALRNVWRGSDQSRRHQHLATAMRWLAPALFGDRLGRFTAAIGVFKAYVRVRLANLFGSSRKLHESLRAYVAALIPGERLSSIASMRRVNGRADRQNDASSLPYNIFSPGNAGLHLIDNSQGQLLRWSEPAAIVRIDLPAGESVIGIECAPIFLLPTIKELRFHLDGQEVPESDVLIEPFRIVIKARVATAGSSTLGWTCSRFAAPNDPRALGLPISKVDLVASA